MLEVVSEDIGREGGRFIDVDALRIGAQEAEKSCCGEKDIRFHDAKITIVSARRAGYAGGFEQKRTVFRAMLEVYEFSLWMEVIVTFWRGSNQESVRPCGRPDVRAKEILSTKEFDIVNYCTDPRTSKEIDPHPLPFSQ